MNNPNLFANKFMEILYKLIRYIYIKYIRKIINGQL